MEKYGKYVVSGLIGLAIIAVVAGFFVMLAVGVVHSIFGSPKAISFVQGIELAFALSVFGAFFQSRGNK